MVEKRQPRSDAGAAPIESEDEVERRRREELLEGLPDGLKPLPTVHDELATELLELAERQVAEMRKRFGPSSSKPRLKRIEDLFVSKVGRAPRVSEEMQRLMRGPAAIQRVAVLDGSFDRALAAAFNAYDKSSVQSGSHVQTAYDDWSMAVRIYKSELRAAGSLLAAEIDAANHPATPPQDYDDYEDPVRAEPHVRHYVRSAKIGQSLLAYEKTMQQAGTALAGAYGQLNTELYNAADGLAVAEATLIAATQTAYSIFWTGAQSAVGQARS
ncbi:hypothetical protein [Brevundimonas sp.]|uniref:hypothetical protein n=1 Tax=Brevundimonas sp. TaxID=1871086 RepID=UPI002D714A32|nr:hypothetical protein [Brevundimonas sp.]HYC74665.1 hypothetical protein [Brevundimonas sp.]